MPAEAQRLRRPIGRRDWNVLTTIVIASGLSLAAAALFSHDENPRRGSAVCVSYDQAGVMGGGTWNLCGAAAVSFCRQPSARTSAVAEQCRSLQRRLAAANELTR